MLAGHVAHRLRRGGQPGDRRHHDDAAAPSYQFRQAGPRRGQARCDVAAQSPFPGVVGDIRGGARAGPARVRHQHVHAAEPRHRGLDHPRHARRVGRVGRNGQRPAAQRRRRLAQRARAAPGQDDRGALGGEPRRRRRADPGPRAGDDRDLAVHPASGSGHRDVGLPCDQRKSAGCAGRCLYPARAAVRSARAERRGRAVRGRSPRPRASSGRCAGSWPRRGLARCRDGGGRSRPP
jgi:hypothetical protein